MKARATLLYLCFFLSGASALVYEIVWQRMLTLVFGLTTFSVAAVLAAFLAGLACGARLFGRWADRAAEPARLYAGVELGIAIVGAASAYFIPPLMRTFAVLYALLEPGWLGSNLIRFVLAFAALVVPSVLIGATVPVMARLVSDRVPGLGVAFGRFYTVNTFGALCGAAAAGFFLIRTVGVHQTLHCAVLGNVVAALLAAAAGPRTRPTPTPAVAPVPQPLAHLPARSSAGAGGPAPGAHPRLALALAAAAGAVALAYEVAWIRLIAVYTLNSVYVFTMVVSVYLAALALGAGIAARLMRRADFNILRALVVTQAVLACCVPVLLGAVPLAGSLEITRTDASEGHIFFLEYALTLAVVFFPTVLIGMTLPLLVGLFPGEAGRSGRIVGRIYAWNAVGTILGTAATGTLLIPLIGLRGTLLAAAAANFAIAAVAAAVERTASRFGRVFMPVAAAGFVLLIAAMPPTTRFLRPSVFPNEAVLYYAEGPSATVHVSEVGEDDARYRLLFVDSKSVAGTYREIVTDQKMLAHLPLLLHPAPERALTVGFGTGGTSYSMLQHKVKVDCVEIEPRVPEAARFFAGENGGLVGPDHDSVNFRLILEDARAWLQLAPHRYDVIVTDVTSIQYRGSGNLYTADYFRLMRDRLAPDGLACAWIPASGITPVQLKVLLRTFQSVYPHISVWYMINLPTDFFILVGSDQPLRLDLADIAARVRQPLVERDLARVGMDQPYKLAACLLLADEQVAAYVARPSADIQSREYQGRENQSRENQSRENQSRDRKGAVDSPGADDSAAVHSEESTAVHTDDRPVLDYMTHATPYRNTLTENLTEMLEYHVDPVDRIVRWPDDVSTAEAGSTWARWHAAALHLIRGHAILSENDPDRTARARREYEAAAALIPDDPLTQELVEDLQP